MTNERGARYPTVPIASRSATRRTEVLNGLHQRAKVTKAEELSTVSSEHFTELPVRPRVSLVSLTFLRLNREARGGEAIELIG
jgi:hypothetical protein